MIKTGLYQPFAIKPFPTLYDITASRAISRANILQPSLDCYHGDKHCNLRFFIQIEKIRKDRQHSPALLLEPFSLLLPQLLLFLIFSRQSRPSSSVSPPDLGIEPDHNGRPQDPPQIRPPQQTIARVSDPTTEQSMHQRPHLTIVRPDHKIRSAHRLTIHDCSISNQHSPPNLVKWCRSDALFVGWVKGGI